MSALLLVMLCCLSSLGSGYHTKRQLGPYQWYDPRVPQPEGVHPQQQQFQVPDRPALIFAPQYHEPRAHSEQVAMVARVFPVLIHFLSPMPPNVGQQQLQLEQSPQPEQQYQLALELVPGQQQLNSIDVKLSNGQPRSGNHSSKDSEQRQIGTRVSTQTPSEESE